MWTCGHVDMWTPIWNNINIMRNLEHIMLQVTWVKSCFFFFGLVPEFIREKKKINKSTYCCFYNLVCCMYLFTSRNNDII